MDPAQAILNNFDEWKKLYGEKLSPMLSIP